MKTIDDTSDGLGNSPCEEGSWLYVLDTFMSFESFPPLRVSHGSATEGCIIVVIPAGTSVPRISVWTDLKFLNPHITPRKARAVVFTCILRWMEQGSKGKAKSLCPYVGLQEHVAMPGLFTVDGDLDSGPHTHLANPLTHRTQTNANPSH